FVYEDFLQQTTSSGKPLLDDPRPMDEFHHTVGSCKQRCGMDPRCDCAVFTEVNGRCEKRQACDSSPSFFQQHAGQSVFLKVPEARFDWQELNHTNLVTAAGGSSEGQVLEGVTAEGCRRTCDVSEFCECVVHQPATGRCKKFSDCTHEMMMADSLYNVYLKLVPKVEDPKVEPSPFQDIPYAIAAGFVALLILGVCLLFRGKGDSSVRT
ncbi:unnamed protein product, partial [Polarella glacialis]